MRKKSPSHLNTRLIRVKLEDHTYLVKLSLQEDIPIAELVHEMRRRAAAYEALYGEDEETIQELASRCTLEIVDGRVTWRCPDERTSDAMAVMIKRGIIIGVSESAT